METKDSEFELPGSLVKFQTACSTGSYENTFGVGSILLDLHRPNNDYKWIDLGEIFYSAPSLSKYEDAKTSPPFSEGEIAFGDIKRRLSKKQALLIVKKINEMIMREFPNGIPPDAQIS